MLTSREHYSDLTSRLFCLFTRSANAVNLFLRSDPNVYLQAARSMPLPTFKCAMVSAHIWDLRAAAGQGMKTIYLRRDSEDGSSKNQIKSKMDGGEVDIVVDSLTELAAIIGSGSGLT
jgi:beta-phosphoglucomutase-like phosphatase (HAD superfamily)